MKVEMKGHIISANAKVDSSSDVVKRLQLEVHGDLAAVQGIMKQPLLITLEPLQASFGSALPERSGGKRAKREPRG